MNDNQPASSQCGTCGEPCAEGEDCPIPGCPGVGVALDDDPHEGDAD